MIPCCGTFIVEGYSAEFKSRRCNVTINGYRQLYRQDMLCTQRIFPPSISVQCNVVIILNLYIVVGSISGKLYVLHFITRDTSILVINISCARNHLDDFINIFPPQKFIQCPEEAHHIKCLILWLYGVLFRHSGNTG